MSSLGAWIGRFVKSLIVQKCTLRLVGRYWSAKYRQPMSFMHFHVNKTQISVDMIIA
jgi:hypothetical protein